MSGVAVNPLRPIIHRLNSTAVGDLPQYVGYLASSILRCESILREADSQKGEASLAVHKLKTRISTLLQDRTPEGRFAGIALVKAIIDAGGSNEHSFLATWARMLISCLNKADPVELKRLALITITRIFLLTVESPSLVREVTSPVLPSFISTTISLIRPIEVQTTSAGHQIPSPMMETVLQSWLRLIPEFGATFRPHANSLKAISLSLLDRTSTAVHLRALLADLFAVLSCCSPKNGAGSEHETACLQVLQSTHQNADVLFRSVIEEWRTSQTSPSSISGKISSEVKTKAADLVGMDQWSGIKAGVDRLQALLMLLSSLVSLRQSQAVSMPIAQILDLTGRLTSIAPPSATFVLRNNSEIGRDEREELWLYLPDIHLSVLKLLSALTLTYGQALRPAGHTMMLQVLDVFASGAAEVRLREAAFKVMRDLLANNLAKPSQSDLSVFSSLVQGCCRDLNDADQYNEGIRSGGHGPRTLKMSATENNMVSAPIVPQQADLWSSSQLADASKDLLPLVLAKSADTLSSTVRTQIDQSVILANQQAGMLASVLHQQHSKGGSRIASSILPFLARADEGSMVIEALLRPRMPLIRETLTEPEALESSEDQETLGANGHMSLDSMLDLENEAGQETREMLHSATKREYDLYNSDLPLTTESEDFNTKKRKEMSPSRDVVPIVESGNVLEAQTEPQASAQTLDDTVPMLRQQKKDISIDIGATVTTEELTISQKNSATAVPVDALDDSSDDEIPQIDATISDEDED